MDGEKVTRSQYEMMKEKYLTKNRSMHTLYIEMYEECGISRQLFFRLINKIRQEEGLSDFYLPKKKKRNKKIINHQDKSPNSYNH